MKQETRVAKAGGPGAISTDRANAYSPRPAPCPHHADAGRSFREAILAAGMQPPEVIEAGKVHRFPGAGKWPSNRAGWCLLFAGERAGVLGCWASGWSIIWRADGRQLTNSEHQQAAEAKRRAKRERAEAQRQAAERAARILRSAKPAHSAHPYLRRKCIAPHCARQSGPRLVLPIVTWDGEISSAQFIGPEGDKRMLTGGRKRGRFIPVHGERAARRIVIAEGFATAATLAETEPDALILAALDAGNLEPVAVEARRRHPNVEIIIAADADAVGIRKARAAALASGGLVAVPEFPPGAEGSDFNDLAALQRHGGVA